MAVSKWRALGFLITRAWLCLYAPSGDKLLAAFLAEIPAESLARWLAMFPAKFLKIKKIEAAAAAAEKHQRRRRRIPQQQHRNIRGAAA